MAFASALGNSLRNLRSKVPAGLASDGLEHVLSRHLLTVEAMAERELVTSILLLDREGKRLRHGAAPNLPSDFCRAIDGAEIGPSAGSCGTAAYLGQPIYVSDIATDPLWAGYRELALLHGLRACWSTPIRDRVGTVIGTFAIYRREVGGPTKDEIGAIEMITDHVSEAIVRARSGERLESGVAGGGRGKPAMTLVHDAAALGPPPEWFEALSRSLEQLQSHADALDRCAGLPEAGTSAEALKAAAMDCKKLIEAIRSQIEPFGYPGSRKSWLL